MKKLLGLLAPLLIVFGAQAKQTIEIQVQASPNFSITADEPAPAPPVPVPPAPPRTIDAYSYNFGRVWLNSVQYATYKLTNTGTTPLTFQSASIYGGDYSASHSCAGVLQPNQACRFDIRFSPFFEGLHSGRFILSFVENLDILVDLWGEGYRF